MVRIRRHRMYRSQNPLIILVLLSLIVLIGCQGHTASPDIQNETELTANLTHSNTRSHHSLGAYLVELNKQELTAEAIPLRTSDIHLNLSKIFINMMGLDIAVLPGLSDPPNGLFVLDFTLTHPLGGAPQYTIFDVKGIVMTPGTLNLGPLVFADVDETRLENADGYTRWWNPKEFSAPGIFGYTDGLFTNTIAGQLTATVNPYKYFADILGPEDPLTAVHDEPLTNDMGRGVFSSGASNTRRYELRFPLDPNPVILFGYVIDGCWDIPVPNPPDAVPDDFPIIANQPEAYDVVMAAKINTLYFDNDSGIGGGRLNLQANIHDWQGQDAGAIAAEVGSINFYIPELYSGNAPGVFIDELPVKARYSVHLSTTLNPTHSGETLVAVEVIQEGDLPYDQGTGKPAPLDPVSAWETLIVEIADVVCTADTNNNFNEAIPLNLGSQTKDQLCAPTDAVDFFEIEFPSSNIISGSVTLYCDKMPTTFGLYDNAQVLITDDIVYNGTAVLDLDSLNLTPGTYYLRVETQVLNEAFIYMIEPGIVLETIIPPNPIDVTPDDLYFYPLDLLKHGDFLYIMHDQGLWIYDYTNVADPVFQSYIDHDWFTQPQIFYPYIYHYQQMGPSDYQLELIDVTDPTNPVVHGGLLNKAASSHTFIVDDTYLYLTLDTTPSTTLEIYDIATDPFVPSLVASNAISPSPMRMELINDAVGPDYWLAIMYEGNSVEVFNVTDKSNIPAPDLVTFLNSYLNSICSIDNYLFVQNINTVLFTNYLTPIKIDTNGWTAYPALPLPNDVYGVTNNDSHIWFIEDGPVYRPIYINTPASPVLVPPVPVGPAWPYAILADNDILYSANGVAGLWAYSITDVLNVTELGVKISLANPQDLDISGDYLFSLEQSGDFNSIKSVDISDPANAYFVSVLTLANQPMMFCVDGDRMVVATNDPWIQTVDCSDPTNMVSLVSDTLSGDAQTMEIYGDTLYIGIVFPPRLSIWDLSSWPIISNPLNLIMTGTPDALAFKDNVMYILIDNDVQVFSITNSLNPIFTTTYVPADIGKNIAVDGNYLFIATPSTMEIADISVPNSPTFVAMDPHPDLPNGEYLAVENYFAILQPYLTTPPTLFQVWPPTAPVNMGPLYDPGYGVKPNMVMINNGYYYEQYPGTAVRIWDLF